MAFDGAKSTKRIFRMVVRWIINIVIVLILVKAFSFSFDFMYNVFLPVQKIQVIQRF